MCQCGQLRAREHKENCSGSETRCNYFRGFHGTLLFILTWHRQKIRHLQLSVQKDLLDCTEAPHHRFSITHFMISLITVDDGSEIRNFCINSINLRSVYKNFRTKRNHFKWEVLKGLRPVRKRVGFSVGQCPHECSTPGILRGDHVWYYDFIGIMKVLSWEIRLKLSSEEHLVCVSVCFQWVSDLSPRSL